MAKTQFKFVGNHAQDIADGRMLAPGDVVELSDEAAQDPHNQALIERGQLIAAEKGKSQRGGEE